MTRSPLISANDLRDLPVGAVILDARASRAAYDAGHLAGAQHADLETQLSAARDPGADPQRGGRHPLPSLDRWLRTIGEWGITPSTTVVVYDDQGGANAAARAWWMLRSIGHESVFVLDGGIQAATNAGLELTSAAPARHVAEPYPAREWTWPTVDMGDVDRLRADPAWRVLDVRSRERFRGEAEPIDPVAGRIPGAVNLPFAENMDGGTFKSADILRTMYSNLLGDTDPRHLAVHCGSGVTACHTLLALEAAGLHGASLYVGSWGEWCRNPMPQARG